ncbi:MAG: tetratricopeptide repeat protein [Desulfobulbaceae bacterium]|nr:tetratricopeptide repeat protein [Desulfobulbaceae bacterium]
MSDVVLLQVIQSGFWLIVISTLVFLFRKELKMLLQSLASFEVAGAAFQFSDRKETLRSYALLSDTLIDLLSYGDRIEELRRLLHPSQIESLGAFALKYTAEVEQSEWNEELLKNIAYLLLRFGRYKLSIQLYEALLEKRPDHVELLNLKALALMTSRLPDPIMQAKELFLALTKRYPENAHIRFNYSLALSLSEEAEESSREMRRAIDDGYWKNNEDPLSDPLFHHVRDTRPDLLDDLRNHLANVREMGQIAQQSA